MVHYFELEVDEDQFCHGHQLECVFPVNLTFHNVVPYSHRVCGECQLERDLFEKFGMPFSYRKISDPTYPDIPYENPIEYVHVPVMSTSRHFRVVLLIMSKVQGFYDRNLIRQHIPGMIRQYNMTYCFIIARDSTYDAEIADESRKYHDVLQMNHVDNYHNLTLTTMGALHYVYLYNMNADYFMKMDSDCGVNIHRLHHMLYTLSAAKADYAGECRSGQHYNIFNQTQKNYIPAELIGGIRNVSTYARGAAYLISKQALPKLLVGFRHLPFIGHQEDVNVGRAMALARIPCTAIEDWLARKGCDSFMDCQQYYIAHRREEHDSVLNVMQYYQELSRTRARWVVKE